MSDPAPPSTEKEQNDTPITVSGMGEATPIIAIVIAIVIVDRHRRSNLTDLSLFWWLVVLIVGGWLILVGGGRLIGFWV